MIEYIRQYYSRNGKYMIAQDLENICEQHELEYQKFVDNLIENDIIIQDGPLFVICEEKIYE